MGLAFAGERGVYASEGNSGPISYFDNTGERRRFIDLRPGRTSRTATAATWRSIRTQSCM